MIDLENTTYYCVRVTERMDKQAHKKIDHKSENVWVLTEKYYRLLLQHHAIDLIKKILIYEPKHSISPVSTHLLPWILDGKL